MNSNFIDGVLVGGVLGTVYERIFRKHAGLATLLAIIVITVILIVQ